MSDVAGWACTDCTFENLAGAGQCDMCGSARPGTWACKSCTLQNGLDAESCVACRAPRAPRRRPKKADGWRPANELLATRPPPRAAPARHMPAKRWQPARSRGQFVQGACRLVFGEDGEGWQHTWRVDMPCSEIASCPICLEEPSMPRISECGHIFCLPCILRHLQAATACPICGVGPMMAEELRPVHLEVVRVPQVGDEWPFQLIRRTGQNIGLPWQQHSAALTQEGSDGWRFARRVRGDPVYRLDLLHREILALEKAREDPEAGLEHAAATSLITKLQQQLMEVTAAAAAAEMAGAGMKPAATPAQEDDVPTVVFYQSADTQLIFLEPSLTKQLLATYGSWAKLPERIILKSLKAVRDVSVSNDLLRWHRFLAHLSIGGEVIFADGAVEIPNASVSGKQEHLSKAAPQQLRQQRSGKGRSKGRGGRSSSSIRGGRGRGCNVWHEGYPTETASAATEPGRKELMDYLELNQGARAPNETPAQASPPVLDAWDD